MKTPLLIVVAMFVLGPAGLSATSGQAAIADLPQSGLLMTIDPAAIDGGPGLDEHDLLAPLVTYDEPASASGGEGRGAEQDTILAHAPVGAAPELLPWVIILLVFAGLGFSSYRKARKSEAAFDLS